MNHDLARREILTLLMGVVCLTMLLTHAYTTRNTLRMAQDRTPYEICKASIILSEESCEEFDK